MSIQTIDELIDYVESKRISTYKLAKAAGYSRSYVRNVIKEGFIPSQEGIDILIEAALDVGEQVTFNRYEMNLIQIMFNEFEIKHTDPSVGLTELEKPHSMTNEQWKTFLGKLNG